MVTLLVTPSARRAHAPLQPPGGRGAALRLAPRSRWLRRACWAVAARAPSFSEPIALRIRRGVPVSALPATPAYGSHVRNPERRTRALLTLRARASRVMVDGSRRVEFDDVEVIRDANLILMCRVGTKVVAVPPLRMLPGTTIARTGDRGRLVLSRELALNLGLV